MYDSHQFASSQSTMSKREKEDSINEFNQELGNTDKDNVEKREREKNREIDGQASDEI